MLRYSTNLDPRDWKKMAISGEIRETKIATASISFYVTGRGFRGIVFIRPHSSSAPHIATACPSNNSPTKLWPNKVRIVFQEAEMVERSLLLFFASILIKANAAPSLQRPSPSAPLLTLETTVSPSSLSLHDMPVLSLRPSKSCPSSQWAFEKEEKAYFCPSHAAGQPQDWPCIRATDLCNGVPDCPNSEDENPTLCLFHIAERDLILEVQRVLGQHFLKEHAISSFERKSIGETWDSTKWAPFSLLRCHFSNADVPLHSFRLGLFLHIIRFICPLLNTQRMLKLICYQPPMFLLLTSRIKICIISDIVFLDGFLTLIAMAVWCNLYVWGCVYIFVVTSWRPFSRFFSFLHSHNRYFRRMSLTNKSQQLEHKTCRIRKTWVLDRRFGAQLRMHEWVHK